MKSNTLANQVATSMSWRFKITCTGTHCSTCRSARAPDVTNERIVSCAP
jgi:hypothetical protein